MQKIEDIFPLIHHKIVDVELINGQKMEMMYVENHRYNMSLQDEEIIFGNNNYIPFSWIKKIEFSL
jgi:hypothetical protein